MSNTLRGCGKSFYALFATPEQTAIEIYLLECRRNDVVVQSLW